MEERKISVEALKRFESRFRVTPGCWEWISVIAKNGYGRITVNYRSIDTHRLAYQIYVGPIPEGMHVLHKCDNRRCVNPAHLFLGTNAENMRDKCSKGRQHQGAEHYRAKLSVEQVLAIRCDARSQRTIAKDLGVTQSCISKIKNNQSRRAS